MKVMVIDFANTDHIMDILPKGLKILVEKKDGGQAYKITGEELPDMIFVNYKDKPSHGRQTANSIKERKKTSKIPIYFVDGNEIENEKVKHIGLCINSKEVNKYVQTDKNTGR